MTTPVRNLFRRNLSQEFVETLKHNPFWTTVCSDRQLQPEIRNNVVTIYFCGQALIRDLRLQGGNLSGSVHHKFVPLQKMNPSIYLPVTWKSPKGFAFEEQLLPQIPGEGKPEIVNAYKRLMKFEAGPEDLLQQAIICQPHNLIIDQQVEFPIEGSNKIDICYYDPSIEKIVFAEIKRKDDVRLIGPNEEPEVIAQLRAYGETIQKQQDAILAAITKVIRLKRELGLGDRLQGIPEDGLKLEPKPLLVIGNCNDQDVSQIQNTRKLPRNGGPWSPLWKHLEHVACGLIACGPKGCRMSIRGGGGQRWWFGE